jgi:hypothetical protein
MKLTHAVLCLLVWICPTAVLAEIDDAKHIKIDFTNADDTAAQATWSNPDRLTISKDGLGWDGDSAAEFDRWIQTKPLALGLSWRPPYAIQANVAVEPPPQEFKLGNGQSSTPDAGDAYVRYSPDRVHWSNWQVLQRVQSNPAVEKQKPQRRYSGQIRVSYREREEYSKLLADYSALDVPWKSDEEASAKWIVEHEPEFFAQHLPFIGYVEFMFEGGFYGGRRLTSLNVDIYYGMGGLHAIPKDPEVYKKRQGPWNFRGKEASNTVSDSNDSEHRN